MEYKRLSKDKSHQTPRDLPKVALVPDSVKGTGFFTPMDIAPGEYVPNKIDADSWFVSCTRSLKGECSFYAKIEYRLADETDTKSHRFATYAEAYQWIANQVSL